MPDGQRSCPLCNTVARHQMKVHPDRNADLFDCDGCGIFEIGRSTQMAVLRGRDGGDFRDHIRDIRAANERGFVYCYPGGELTAGHLWLKGKSEGTTSGQG